MKRRHEKKCLEGLRSAQSVNTAGPSIQSVVEDVKVFIRSISVIATSKAVQLTDSTWDAVVTSVDRGTFLIRQRKDYIAGQCPCLGYEVRHIDAGGLRDSSPQDNARVQPLSDPPDLYAPSVVMALAQTPHVSKPKVVRLPDPGG